MTIKKGSPRFTYKNSLKEKTRQLRKNATPAEKHFWNALRMMPFYEEITFNRQKPLGNYVADFFSLQLELVIEIDGDSHGDSSSIAYDSIRTSYFESNGLMVIRFTNREVLSNIEGVMERISQMVKEKSKNPPNPL